LSSKFQITFQLRREKEKTRKKPNSHTPPLQSCFLILTFVAFGSYFTRLELYNEVKLDPRPRKNWHLLASWTYNTMNHDFFSCVKHNKTHGLNTFVDSAMFCHSLVKNMADYGPNNHLNSTQTGFKVQAKFTGTCLVIRCAGKKQSKNKASFQWWNSTQSVAISCVVVQLQLTSLHHFGNTVHHEKKTPINCAHPLPYHHPRSPDCVIWHNQFFICVQALPPPSKGYLGEDLSRNWAKFRG